MYVNFEALINVVITAFYLTEFKKIYIYSLNEIYIQVNIYLMVAILLRRMTINLNIL